jgi:integrase
MTGKRNVNGEGNIRQRSDGRWEGRAYVVTTDGREIRRSVYGKSWEEVDAKLTKLRADRMVGKRVAFTKMTVVDYIEYWFGEHASDRDRIRDTTYETYRYLARAYLVPAFGNKKLVRLRPPDIRRELAKIKKACQCCAQGKDRARLDRDGARCCAKQPPECCRRVPSTGTILALHRLLRVILQDAVTQDELLTDNVAKGLKLDHTYRPNFRTWSAEEARRFLRVARDDRLYALYAVALALGLRRGEALGRGRALDLHGPDGQLR